MGSAAAVPRHTIVGCLPVLERNCACSRTLASTAAARRLAPGSAWSWPTAPLDAALAELQDLVLVRRGYVDECAALGRLEQELESCANSSPSPKPSSAGNPPHTFMEITLDFQHECSYACGTGRWAADVLTHSARRRYFRATSSSVSGCAACTVISAGSGSARLRCRRAWPRS